MCARTDIQVQGVVRDPHFERPTIYLADNYPGGVGLAEAAWNLRDRLMTSAWEALDACPCKDGCPACVGALRSKLNAKEATRQLLVVLRQAFNREEKV